MLALLVLLFLHHAAEILVDVARNGVHDMIPDAYEKNQDPKYVLYNVFHLTYH